MDEFEIRLVLIRMEFNPKSVSTDNFPISLIILYSYNNFQNVLFFIDINWGLCKKYIMVKRWTLVKKGGDHPERMFTSIKKEI